MHPEQYTDLMAEYVEEVVNLYHANYLVRCIPRMKYEEDMKELLIKICKIGIDYALCCTHGDYQIKKEQFGRYIWHLENIPFNNHDVFKIIGDVYKLLDNEEFFWKSKDD